MHSNTRKTCKVDGCDNNVRARGMCHKHYENWRCYGRRKEGEQPLVTDKPCIIPGCENRIGGGKRGMCKKHYTRWLRHGDPEATFHQKNDYEVCGEITVLFIRREDGTVMEALIDTEDLPLVLKAPNRWTASYRSKHDLWYVVTDIRTEDGSRKRVYLHRWILNPPENMVVDHINGNGLDNRKSNLRVVTQAQNNQNRRGATRANSSSGFRGVYWDNRRNKWKVAVKVNKRTIQVGRFDSLHQAVIAAKEARRKYLPYSIN